MRQYQTVHRMGFWEKSTFWLTEAVGQDGQLYVSTRLGHRVPRYLVQKTFKYFCVRMFFYDVNFKVGKF